jgi:hypothetical protein
MLALLNYFPRYWMEGAVRTRGDLRRGASEPFPLHEDPPVVTPY